MISGLPRCARAGGRRGGGPPWGAPRGPSDVLDHRRHQLEIGQEPPSLDRGDERARPLSIAARARCSSWMMSSDSVAHAGFLLAQTPRSAFWIRRSCRRPPVRIIAIADVASRRDPFVDDHGDADPGDPPDDAPDLHAISGARPSMALPRISRRAGHQRTADGEHLLPPPDSQPPLRSDSAQARKVASDTVEGPTHGDHRRRRAPTSAGGSRARALEDAAPFRHVGDALLRGLERARPCVVVATHQHVRAWDGR